MSQSRLRLEFPNQGDPLTRWLALVVAAIGFAVAMTLGLVLFVFFLGLALVALGIIALRVWWLKRKLGWPVFRHRSPPRHQSGENTGYLLNDRQHPGQ